MIPGLNNFYEKTHGFQDFPWHCLCLKIVITPLSQAPCVVYMAEFYIRHQRVRADFCHDLKGAVSRDFRTLFFS